MTLRIPAFFHELPHLVLQMSLFGLMLFLCIFHTQNLCRSSKIGGLGSGCCGHSIIIPLCLSLLLTVFPSSSVGPSPRPQSLGINLQEKSGKSSFRPHLLQVTSLCSSTESCMAAVWLSAPQAASSSAPPLPPPLTLVLSELFLTLFLVPFLLVQHFLPFLNYVFPAVTRVWLMSHGTSIMDLALSRSGQLLLFSHRCHPCSSSCCQHLVTDTPHFNTSILFSCSTFKVLQCWLPHSKSHIYLQSINNLI